MHRLLIQHLSRWARSRQLSRCNIFVHAVSAKRHIQHTIRPERLRLHMNQRFTQQAIETIMLAQQEARRTDRAFVGTEQILIGLIDEASGVAAQVLASKGIDRTSVVMETEKIIGARGPTYPSDLEIPFTGRAKRNLELSWDEARKLGHNYIGTEHLLLVLIQVKEGIGAVVLGNMNVDLEQLQTDVIALIKETSSNEPASDPGTEKSQVVRLAREEERRLGHNFVGTEQLLLGLIGEDGGIASEALKSMGFSLKKGRVEVEKKIRSRGGSSLSTRFPF